jgi:hypothetical protein
MPRLAVPCRGVNSMRAFLLTDGSGAQPFNGQEICGMGEALVADLYSVVEIAESQWMST